MNDDIPETNPTKSVQLLKETAMSGPIGFKLADEESALKSAPVDKVGGETPDEEHLGSGFCGGETMEVGPEPGEGGGRRGSTTVLGHGESDPDSNPEETERSCSRSCCKAIKKGVKKFFKILNELRRFSYKTLPYTPFLQIIMGLVVVVFAL